MVWRSLFVAAVVVTIAAALYPNFKLSSLFQSIRIDDAVIHLSAFATLTLIAAGSWRLSVRMMILLILFALGLELAQAYSPGRQVSLSDAMASLSGIVLGVVVTAITLVLRRSVLRWTGPLATDKTSSEPGL